MKRFMMGLDRKEKCVYIIDIYLFRSVFIGFNCDSVTITASRRCGWLNAGVPCYNENWVQEKTISQFKLIDEKGFLVTNKEDLTAEPIVNTENLIYDAKSLVEVASRREKEDRAWENVRMVVEEMRGHIKSMLTEINELRLEVSKLKRGSRV